MNKIVMIIIFVVTNMAAYRSHGESIDSLEIAAMVSAQTPDELYRRLAVLENIATDDAACELQLKSHRLPYSCYNARLIRATIHIPPQNHFDHDLDENCARIASQTRDLSVQYPNHLPKHCLDIAREKIRINRYKAGMDFEKFP